MRRRRDRAVRAILSAGEDDYLRFTVGQFIVQDPDIRILRGNCVGQKMVDVERNPE